MMGQEDGVTRPPRFRYLSEMRNRSAMFDDAGSSHASTDVPHYSTERRAKVRMAPGQETDMDSLVTISSRAKVKRRPFQRGDRPPLMGVQQQQKEDVGSIISNWSKPSLVKPLFDFDAASILSAESTRDLFRSDDPWRAAKRGDLTALKQFHTSGKVDWMTKDDFRNVPLYYACQSGAIADIMVVPFLLWVTPLQDDKILEKCKKNSVNKQVRSILKAYKKGGLSAIGVEQNSVASMSSRQSSTKSLSSTGKEKKKSEEKSKRQDESVLSDDKIGKVRSKDDRSKGSSRARSKSRGRDSCDNDDGNSFKTGSLKSVGSLKSMLFGERSKTRSSEAENRKKSESETVEKGNLPKTTHGASSAQPQISRDVDRKTVRSSPLLDDNSSFQRAFLRTRKPPIIEKASSSLSQQATEFPPRPHPSSRTAINGLFKHHDKDEVEGRDDSEKDERDDMDKPIEQHRLYGNQAVKGTLASMSGRDDDSWSIGSMLSLKKWRDNTKQLDHEKIDKILGTHLKGKYGEKTKESSETEPSSGKNKRSFPKAYIEFHENENTWVIGNQWKQCGTGEKDKMLHVYDHKQRVHVVNCHGVNIHIHGRKMKAVLVDNCSDVNVIFDTVITTCEVVNCSNVGLQVTGVCPTFSIDTSEGVTLWLTLEGMRSSNFVTSKSSEISISVPQSENSHPWERREVPLPVQYVHKFQDGGVMSHLPGKY